MNKVENRVQELWDEAVAQGIRAEKAEAGNKKYSERENPVQAEFERHVDEIEKNTYKGDSFLIMGVTPRVLQDIGLAAIPIGIDKNHVYTIAVSEKQARTENRYREKFNYHNLGFQAVKDIYEKISEPLMVIAHPDFNNNKNQRDSAHKVIAFVDLKVNGKQVIAPIEIDFEAKYNNSRIDINRITTYFDKSNINDFIKEAVALENNNQTGFFYLDKKRTRDIFKRSGYQLPSRLESSSSNVIINSINGNVNRKILDVTQSQQFIRWFGDWQNKPKSINPIFMDNGKPKLFYHGTPNGTFSAFKDWQYFTENKEYADVYHNQGASSNGYKLTATNPYTYAVYLTGNKVFDTRVKSCRDIFQKEFYRKWGNGAPLSEKGLPPGYGLIPLQLTSAVLQ